MKRTLNPVSIGVVALTFSWLGIQTGAIAEQEAGQEERERDILIDDFERAAYPPWTAEGEAFGPGPAEGTLPNQMPVTGYRGKRLVNSYYGGDGTQGTLVSPPFRIERRYLCFLIGGGGYADETFMELLVDGKSVRKAHGPNVNPGGSEELDWESWDVSEFIGKTAVLRIVDRRSGGWGHINVDEIVQSNVNKAAAAVHEFVAESRFLLLPVGDDTDRIRCRLRLEDRVVRYFDADVAEPGTRERFWASVDISEFRGRKLRWDVRPRSAAEIVAAQARQAETPIFSEDLYREALRPQFHFSPRVGWTNDPNGLVYYQGEYHLFFQHNPFGVRWGNMTWGHAVSRDLVHWEELGDALLPDETGTIFSGSAVVDHANTSGLGSSERPPMCAFYTAAGGESFDPRPFTQCMAWSLDRGRTWTKFAGNPVVGPIADGNRDPKVFWFAPASRWIMVLYVRRDAFSLFSSQDLKTWQAEGEVEFPSAFECPELFELPVEESPGETRWVLWSASGNHLIGRFDGHAFRAESPVLPSEWGKNCYAGQTWNDAPDGRRIFIGWMNSDGSAYRDMPFNQQMTFPREFALRNTEDGLRLHALPIDEIKGLYRKPAEGRGIPLAADRPQEFPGGELLDVELSLEGRGASLISLNLRGVEVSYRPNDGTLDCLGGKIEGLPKGKPLHLRLLVDRTSIEVFAADGRYVMSFVLPLDPRRLGLQITADGPAEVGSLAIRQLESIWSAPAEASK
ncbi:MAG: glycoside hydrolase family 32 protein [Thermogutta sp.]|nr:glycoside hydrolase family 32 protein [Thermogutta sp.]